MEIRVLAGYLLGPLLGCSNWIVMELGIQHCKGITRKCSNCIIYTKNSNLSAEAKRAAMGDYQYKAGNVTKSCSHVESFKKLN